MTNIHGWTNWFYVPTWMAHGVPRCLAKCYFWVYLWDHFWMRPAFESVDWVNWWSSPVWVSLIRSAEGLDRTKRWRRGHLASLCLTNKLGHWHSPTMRLRHHGFSWFSGLHHRLSWVYTLQVTEQVTTQPPQSWKPIPLNKYSLSLCVSY